MSTDNMVRRQLYLPQNLNRTLKGWAREKKISESEVIRKALTQFLEREKRRATLPENNPVFKMNGIFTGDESCAVAGENHDQIVYDSESKD